jgi:hypothetical protein
MTLESVIAYVAVLGLPLWLVVEEVLHRFASGAKARVAATAVEAVDRRALEGVRAA